MNTTTALQGNTQRLIALENQYSAPNYHPLPVVLESGKGVYVYDVDGKKYLDFLSGYSAVNQGHAHPVILEAFIEQARMLTLSSRAFHSRKFAEFSEFICEYFGYARVLPMNTGVEAVETAIKLCRRWAYQRRGITENKAKIIVCDQNFHGRTSTVISFSADPVARKDFGPYMPGFESIPYNDLNTLELALQQENVAGFLVEPIQGEAGVVVPDDGYLSGAASLCRQAGVLFMADEIQTGLCRTGKLLACDHEGIRPDILILGKALSGGMMPVSAVLSDDDIMLTLEPGSHGSTFGGNPLGAAVATAALKVLKEERMAENAAAMGERFRTKLAAKNIAGIALIRGKGLLNGVVIEHSDEHAAWNLCLQMMQRGLLAKPTHGNKIRFSPPLLIDAAQIDLAVEIIAESFHAV